MDIKVYHVCGDLSKNRNICSTQSSCPQLVDISVFRWEIRCLAQTARGKLPLMVSS